MFVAKRVPLLDRIAHNFRKLFGVTIEPCCLRNHQIGIDESIYVQNDLLVTSLTLKSLSESDARKLLPFFGGIKQFSMENMKIVEDVDAFPEDLTELSLIECKIEEELFDQWFFTVETTLKRLHMDNFETFVDYPSPCRVCRYFDFRIYDELNLQSLTFKSNSLVIYLEADYLDFLAIISSGPGPSEHSLYANKLKYLHCVVSPDNSVSLREEMPDLRLVTMGEWTHFQSITAPHTSLEEVVILSAIDPKFKAEVDALTIKVVANYWPIPEPPQEPNLIFNMLNYDCLLEIVCYLSRPDWMSFGRLHENAEMVVATYMYPKGDMRSYDFLGTGMYADDQDHFCRVSKLVHRLYCSQSSNYFCADWRHFIGSFENLSSLWLGNLSSDLFDVLPCELDELVLTNFDFDDPSLTAYMRRLSPCLLRLNMYGSNLRNNESILQQWHCLAELHHLQEISIQIPLLPHITAILLERNSRSLVSIELLFDIQEKEGWAPHEKTLNLISMLSKLKELSIILKLHQFNQSIDVQLLAGVLKSVGPSLHKLSLTGDFEEHDLEVLLAWGDLKDLPSLQIEVYWDLVAVRWILRRLKGLRTLQFCHGECPEVDRVDRNSELIQLIESLPNLKKLSIPLMESTFNFEIDLRQYLKQANRSLLVNSGKIILNVYFLDLYL